MADFKACLPVILQSEGGFVIDQGGPTNLGVTQKALSYWLGRAATVAEVQGLTPESVAPLYESDYWNASHCDELPNGLDLLVFDQAVNEGVGRAIRHLQAALNVVVDGAVGPATMTAVRVCDLVSTINALHAINATYYASLAKLYQQDQAGWKARNDRTYKIALAMAKAAVPMAPKPRRQLVTLETTTGTVALGAVATAVVASQANMHIDLSPILTPLIQLAGLILTGVVGWAATRVAAYAHVSTQSTQMQNLLGAVDRGIAYGQQVATTAAQADATVNIPDKTQAAAIQYVVTKMPGTLKSLGMDPTHVADLVLAKLPNA